MKHSKPNMVSLNHFASLIMADFINRKEAA